MRTARARPLITPLLLPACGILLATCGKGPGLSDEDQLIDALQKMQSIPREGFWSCQYIRNAELRSDCTLAGVEAIARSGEESSAALLKRCGQIDVSLASEECAFQVAEILSDPTACAQAGRFETDCRLHLLSGRFSKWTPKDAGADDPDLHLQLIQEASIAGIHAEDLRVWSAWFRWVLGQQSPLDRSVCTRIAQADRSKACFETGKALYNDRLNHARDTRTFPCQGGPLPSLLATTPDPGLDELLQQRKAQDLCP